MRDVVTPLLRGFFRPANDLSADDGPIGGNPSCSYKSVKLCIDPLLRSLRKHHGAWGPLIASVQGDLVLDSDGQLPFLDVQKAANKGGIG